MNAMDQFEYDVNTQLAENVEVDAEVSSNAGDTLINLFIKCRG